MGRSKPNIRKTGSDEIHRRLRYSGPSRQFLEWVQGFESLPIGRWAHRLNRKLGLRQLSIVFGFCLLLAFLIFADLEISYDVQVGDVAAVDLKSPIALDIVDEIATGEKRKAVEAEVPPVFDFDPEVYEQTLNRVYRAFKNIRKEYRGYSWPSSEAAREEATKDFLRFKGVFERDLGVELSDRIFEWLTEREFSVRMENVIIRSIVKWTSRRIMDGQSGLFSGPDSPLLLRVLDGAEHREEFIVPRHSVRDLRKSSEFDLEGVRGIETLSKRDLTNVHELAMSLLTPNLIYNRQETSERRQKARDSVLPVQVSVKKNQTIVSAGNVVQPNQKALLDEISGIQNDRQTDLVALFCAILFMILIMVFFSYFRKFSVSRFHFRSKDLAVMGLVLLGAVGLCKLFIFTVDASLVSRLGFLIPASAILYAAPLAAGPMLVALLITSAELIWLFTLLFSISMAVMLDFSFGYLLVASVAGISAARGVHACEKRNDIYWAGIRSGALTSVTILFLLMIQRLGEATFLSELAWSVPAGLLGGLLSAMVAMTFVPILESAFNYTTNVKLLELVSLNHPLMKEMIVKAPGTYHHSLVVGSMCEAAAEEIGANPLLAKVMAYYHDIGKMEHAQYFIENQRVGHNPHDHISPHMSKTVLIAHVKDGAEMGLEHKLGEPIVDGILQHHGTTLISYFYNKALRSQDDDIDTVLEEDFRYPGPKPQFKEAALLMLADSIEAAARSLDEPTAGRLTQLVKNIIQNKFLDGQLDECDLTLRDLSIIENCYRRVLIGIYHQRVDYPQAPSGKMMLPSVRPTTHAVTKKAKQLA